MMKKLFVPIAACFSTVAARMQKIKGFETTYQVLKEGSGKKVESKCHVTVHATGVVQQTGKKFWSTKDAGIIGF